MQETYPNDNYNYTSEKGTIDVILDMIRQIRNERLNSGINDSRKVNSKVLVKTEEDKEIFILCEDFVKRLGYIDNLEYIFKDSEISKNYTAVTLSKLTIYLDLLSSIDVEKEISKLNEEKEKVLSEIKRAESMLSNENFVKKAPEKLVKSEKEKLVKYKEMLNDIENRIAKFN